MYTYSYAIYPKFFIHVRSSNNKTIISIIFQANKIGNFINTSRIPPVLQTWHNKRTIFVSMFIPTCRLKKLGQNFSPLKNIEQIFQGMYKMRPQFFKFKKSRIILLDIPESDPIFLALKIQDKFVRVLKKKNHIKIFQHQMNFLTSKKISHKFSKFSKNIFLNLRLYNRL